MEHDGIVIGTSPLNVSICTFQAILAQTPVLASLGNCYWLLLY